MKHLPVRTFEANVISKSDEIALKEAITLVKTRMKIPERFSKFDYKLTNQYNSTAFILSWSTPKNDKNKSDEIKVVIIGNIITSFTDSSINNDEKETPSFSKLSFEELINKAKYYFQMFNPQIKSEIRYEVSSLNLFSTDATVRFKRYENGIYLKGNDGCIVLNKDTGELSSFYMNWWDNVNLVNTSKMKSVKEIQESFKKMCILTPYYKIDYDSKTKKTTTQLVYIPLLSRDDEIDAITGDWSSIWTDMYNNKGSRYSGFNDTRHYNNCKRECKTAKNSDEDCSEFTKAELEKIEINDSLPKAEDIKKLLVEDEIIRLPKNSVIKKYTVYSLENKDKIDDFFVSVDFLINENNYERAFVIINAATKAIVKYSRSAPGNNGTLLNVKQANDLADKALKAIAPEYFQEFEPDKKNFQDSWKSDEDINFFERDRIMSYKRVINGIEVLGDYINIGVDSLGNVLSYSCKRTNIEFPEPHILSVDEAFEKLYAQKEFQLYYDCWVSQEGQINTYLIYKMSSFKLDATTGELIYNYDNNNNKQAPIEYVDINNIPQCNKIKELQKYNILLSQTEFFDADKIVLASEFSAALIKILNCTEPWKLDYSLLGNDSNNSESNLTVEMAAEKFVYYSADNSIVPFIPGIFKSPYNDVSEDDDYVGCFAIANAFNFLVPDENNNIHPKKEITRAELIDIFYDFILNLPDFEC